MSTQKEEEDIRDLIKKLTQQLNALIKRIEQLETEVRRI